jgi:hypothetical protein
MIMNIFVSNAEEYVSPASDLSVTPDDATSPTQTHSLSRLKDANEAKNLKK